MYYIEKTYDIEYAHRIFNQEKTKYNQECKCRSLHGHSGKVKVVIQSEKLYQAGMVIDFSDLKPIKEFVEMFDHSLILSREDPMVANLFIGGINIWETPYIKVMEKVDMFDNRVILLDNNDCSSEVIANIMFENIRKILDNIRSELGFTLRPIYVKQVEFSETNNNKIVVTNDNI